MVIPFLSRNIIGLFGQVVDNPQDKTSLSVTVTEAGTENPIVDGYAAGSFR